VARRRNRAHWQRPTASERPSARGLPAACGDKVSWADALGPGVCGGLMDLFASRRTAQRIRRLDEKAPSRQRWPCWAMNESCRHSAPRAEQRLVAEHLQLVAMMHTVPGS
jgi:hypothetical protein